MGDRESSSKSPRGRKSREWAGAVRGGAHGSRREASACGPLGRTRKTRRSRAWASRHPWKRVVRARPAGAQPAETVIAQQGTERDAARVIGQLLSPMARAKTSASSRSTATIGFEATRLDDLSAAQTRTLGALNIHQQGLMQQLFPSPDAVEV